MPKAEKKGQDFPDREIADAGMHPSRCISVIDLGTQTEEFKGEKKLMSKVLLTFELVDTAYVLNEEKGEQPFVLSITRTNSISEKATLRKDILNWRNKPFTPEEEENGFDINVLAGKPCILNVIHKAGKNKKGEPKTYANISSINPPMKGMTIKQPVNPVFTFDIGEKDQFDKFDNLLHEWQRVIIRKSPEWQAQELKRPKGTAKNDLPGSNRSNDEDDF